MIIHDNPTVCLGTSPPGHRSNFEIHLLQSDDPWWSHRWQVGLLFLPGLPFRKHHPEWRAGCAAARGHGGSREGDGSAEWCGGGVWGASWLLLDGDGSDGSWFLRISSRSKRPKPHSKRGRLSGLIYLTSKLDHDCQLKRPWIWFFLDCFGMKPCFKSRKLRWFVCVCVTPWVTLFSSIHHRLKCPFFLVDYLLVIKRGTGKCSMYHLPMNLRWNIHGVLKV